MATKMTPTQRNYAVARIKDIAQQMTWAIRKKYVLKEAKSITIGELVKLILNGTIKPKKDGGHKTYGSAYNDRNNLSDAFAIVDPSPYYRTNPVQDEAKIDAAINKVNAKSTQLSDKLMLSDAATALKLVEDFAIEADTLTKKGK